MKPIEITKQDQFGCDRTFVIRRDEACGKVFLAEIDPDFGFESFCGTFDSVRDFPDMYAPNPKLAITRLDHSDGIVVRPTFESVVAMG